MEDQLILSTVTHFEIYTSNVTSNAYGTVSRAKLFYDASAQRSATATPNTGSSFLGWYLTGTETQVTTNDDFTVASNVITLKRNPVSADIGRPPCTDIAIIGQPRGGALQLSLR
jgi:hypothetical protein